MSNIGLFDRLVRVLIGAGILSTVFIGPQSPWGWIGLLPLATGFLAFCPVYTMLGISTCLPHQKCCKDPQEEKHDKTVSP